MVSGGGIVSHVHAAPTRLSDETRSCITIIPMRPEQVDDVVRVHLDSFPGYFLTCLGPRFLRPLYSEILKAPDHVAFVAQDSSGTLVGFVAGVTHQSGFYTRLARQRWFAFAAASLGAVIRRPTIIPRLFRALSYPRASQAAAAQALLMSIGVEPGLHGHSVGQRLTTRFLVTMKQKGLPSVSLTTDRNANEHANSLYQRLGFQIARSYVTPEGRWMNEYIIDLSTWSPPSSSN
jgi:ribosomal protein S18 acetylase RimI-like enzyme